MLEDTEAIAKAGKD